MKDRGKRSEKKRFSCSFPSCLLFCSFSQVLNFLGCPLSSPPWLSARPEPSLGILGFLLCSCSWLTYLFNYFTVCLLSKWREPCCFFPSALLFKTQAFHVGSGLLGLMAVTSTFDLLWPPRRVWSWAKRSPVYISADKGSITHYFFKHLETLPWEQAFWQRPSQVLPCGHFDINPLNVEYAIFSFLTFSTGGHQIIHMLYISLSCVAIWSQIYFKTNMVKIQKMSY